MSIEKDADLRGYLKSKPGEDGEHGVNIEGIAVRGTQMFVGFRGPVDGRGAIVWELPTQQLFDGKQPVPKVYHLELGQGDQIKTQGVRDLAAVSDGLLILSGPEMRSERPAPALFLWRGGEASPVRLDLPEIDFAGDSPEAIAILSEDARSYKMLILSDGEYGSAPRLVRVTKPN